MVEHFVFETVVYFAAIVGVLAFAGKGKRRSVDVSMAEVMQEIQQVTQDLQDIAEKLPPVASGEYIATVPMATIGDVFAAIAEDYASMTVKQLRDICKRKGMKGYSKLSKVALLDRLNGIA